MLRFEVQVRLGFGCKVNIRVKVGFMLGLG